MKLARRRFLHFATGAAAFPVVMQIARAEAYPSRPVRIVVGFPAGGGIDIVARLMAQWLSERLGQQFIIENRAGAGGNLGVEAVVRAPADGYTLLWANSANAISATFYEKLNYDLAHDIVAIAGVVRVPQVMAVNPSFPAKTVREFIAYAKANPGKINMASAGNGTGNHVAGELFKMMTGVDLVHVPYRGGAPALTDLLGGQVQVVFDNVPSSIGHIRDGKLRALAVTTAERSQALPEIPTVSESVPGYESSIWWGVGAPKNTPVDIIDKLNRVINAGLADPKIRARLAADFGGTVLAGSPADFGQLMAAEIEKWAKVVKFSGAKPD